MSSDDIDQLRVQLAGVLTAAEGATSQPATRGMYGWSPAYQSVLDLRIKFDILVSAVQAYCGQDGSDGSRQIQEWFAKFGGKS